MFQAKEEIRKSIDNFIISKPGFIIEIHKPER
jgi:hypothetical protein